MNDINEDITSTEKFTGTMNVQEKLKFPEKKIRRIPFRCYSKF